MRTSRRPLLARLALALAILPGLQSVHAQQPQQPVHNAIRSFLQSETAGLPGEVLLTIGPFQENNLLPPCASLEPFLPAETRAWGQINVGIQCRAPTSWTAYVPARVAVMGEFLVTARAIRAGQVIGADDLARQHGDLAALPDDTLTDATRANGTYARITLAPGNPLRAGMLRLPPAVQQGQTVKVVGSGTGFSVSNEGRALNRAAAGESVRVRLPNGQVVSGTARHGGVVEVRH